MNFKYGDRVKCINPSGSLSHGSVYTVDNALKYESSISVCEFPNEYYNRDRFKSVEEIVKTVSCIKPPEPVIFSFENYSKDARKTMGKKHYVEYLLIGLSSEAGEVGDVFKKVYEGKSEKVDKDLLRKELGDCLWYLNAIAVSQGITLESVAIENLVKVFSRKEAKKFKDRLNKIEKKFKGD